MEQCQESLCIATLNSTSKNTLPSLLCSLTKLEIRAEQGLPGSERGRGESVSEGSRGEK
jgi:hypothetical protein